MAEDTTRATALVPKDVHKAAKANTPHGKISEEIRRVCEALAEGREYNVDTEEATVTPEERYEQLEERGLPSDWKDRREKVFIRDDYTCRNCQKRGGIDGPANLVPHHIVPDHNGGCHHLSNLATLCAECHNKAHNGL